VINTPSSKIVFALLLLGFCSLSGAAGAHDYRIGSIHIDHPWATATPNGAKVGAGYLKITNEGTQPDRLIALTSPAARKVTLHGSVNENGVVKMRTLENGIEIKPGETVELKPEGAHVMFEDLRAPLLAAASVQATLVFEKAGSIDVDYTIEPMGTKAPPVAPGAHMH
jgi:copper(I)-binding protein